MGKHHAAPWQVTVTVVVLGKSQNCAFKGTKGDLAGGHTYHDHINLAKQVCSPADSLTKRVHKILACINPAREKTTRAGFDSRYILGAAAHAPV